MDIASVRSRLASTRFGDVRWVAETASTNADVLGWAHAGEPEGIVLVADHQTAGRGRLGRTWEAPAGSSLLVSLLTRPSVAPAGLANRDAYLVSMAVGVAASMAVSEAAGVEVRLKWPNDLVVDTADGTRKLSGILAESTVAGGEIDALVVGIGVNVNWPDDIPAELAGIATAANHLAGHALEREAILVALLAEFDRLYAALALPSGRDDLRSTYRTRSATLGSRVRVELSGEAFVGEAVDITDEGHLLVVGDGPEGLREITAGDVIHLRGHD